MIFYVVVCRHGNSEKCVNPALFKIAIDAVRTLYVYVIFSWSKRQYSSYIRILFLYRYPCIMTPISYCYGIVKTVAVDELTAKNTECDFKKKRINK